MLIDLLFPKLCIFCGTSGRYVCRHCLHTYIQFIYAQTCHVCSIEARSGFMHTECRDLSYVDGVVSVCKYDTFSKTLVRKLKYGQVSDISSDISIIMYENLHRYTLSDFVVTSVPMHVTKQRYRGFNQAQLIAQQFCTIGGFEYVELITRSRFTKSQVGMDKDHRLQNLKEAFTVIQKETTRIQNQKILVIDDVYTTGATLNEIAKVLKQSGAKEVYGYTFAKRG